MSYTAILRGYVGLLFTTALSVALIHAAFFLILRDSLLRGCVRTLDSRAFHPRGRRLRRVVDRVSLGLAVLLGLLLSESLIFFAVLQGRVRVPDVVTIWVTVAMPVLYVFCHLLLGRFRYRRSMDFASGIDWSPLDDHDRPGAVRELVVTEVRERMIWLPLVWVFFLPAWWSAILFVIATLPPSGRGGQGEDFQGFAVVAFGAAGLAGAWIANGVRQHLFPHRDLIQEGFWLLRYLDRFVTGERHPRSGALRRSFVSARWRTPTHRSGYRLARCLDRCVLAMEHRMVPLDYDRLADTYRKIAWELRGRAARVARKPDEVPAYRELVVAAIALLEVEDTAALPARVGALVEDRLDQPDRSSAWRRRYQRIEVLAQNSLNLIKTVGVLALIVGFAVTRQWTELGGLVK